MISARTAQDKFILNHFALAPRHDPTARSMAG
jgi:hypothetical protein